MNQSQYYINAIPAALYANGVRHAVISPGSRNAPLIMAFARFGKIQCHSVIDERSAGFIALGLSISNDFPAAVICTSGSALANIYPSVLEAFYMQVPMIVISADRPAAMIDKWDGQTIHQENFFGKHIKSSFVTPEDAISEQTMVDIAEKAVQQSATGIKGPVHINVPLNEPLYAAVKETFVYPNVEPKTLPKWNKAELPNDLKQAIESSQKVMLLFGADYVKDEFEVLNPHSNTVCLSDIISNKLKHGSINNWESVLLQSKNVEHLLPQVLVTFGKMVLNKNLKQALRNATIKCHYHIDPSGFVADTFDTHPIVVQSDFETFAQWMNHSSTIDSDYLVTWNLASAKQSNITFDDKSFNEFAVMSRVLQSLSEHHVLHLSNSMTIRNAAYNAQFLNHSIKVYSNRGVSGIDGCTSTALGLAMGNRQEQHTLITGDIAFLYDVNALLNQTFPDNLRIIVMNNRGGGIFKLLDGPSEMKELNPYVFTPHNIDLKLIADIHSIDYLQVNNYNELQAFTNSEFRSGIVDIMTDSEINTSIFKLYKSNQI